MSPKLNQDEQTRQIENISNLKGVLMGYILPTFQKEAGFGSVFILRALKIYTFLLFLC